MWRECQEAKAKWKQTWLQLKSVLRSDLVSNLELEILGNQTKGKNIHHFGSEKWCTRIAPGTKEQNKTLPYSNGCKEEKMLFYKAIKSSNLAVRMKAKP